MEDVWITPSVGEVLCWLDDKNVCAGIQAMHKCNWCLEEQHWLGMEADNLCWWFGNEIAAVELALRTLGSA